MRQTKIDNKTYKFDIYFLLSIFIVYFLTYFSLYTKLFLNGTEIYPDHDLYVHIKLMDLLKDDPNVFLEIIPYPLWHLLVWIANIITGIDLFNLGIIITSLFNSFTVGILYYIINKKTEKLISHKIIICVLSIFIIMIMPIYAPWFNKYFAVGQWSPNSWHNPTYIAVRPIALLIVYYWIELYNKYFTKKATYNDRKNNLKPHMSIKEMAIFAMLMVISLFLKPSLLPFFIPAALLFLFIECIFNKGYNIIFFLQSIIIFLIPIVVFIVQYNLLFTQGVRAGIGFGFAKSWSLFSDNIFVSFLLSTLFPLYVIIDNFKSIFKNKHLFFSIIMLIFALCEYIFIYEVGSEADSNMAWGYMLSLFFIWVFSIITFIKSYCIEKNQLTLKKYISVNIGFGLLIIYIFYGIYYYIRLYGTPVQLF